MRGLRRRGAKKESKAENKVISRQQEVARRNHEAGMRTLAAFFGDVTPASAGEFNVLNRQQRKGRSPARQRALEAERAGRKKQQRIAATARRARRRRNARVR